MGVPQIEAAQSLGLTQPRLSALLNARVELFSLDALVGQGIIPSKAAEDALHIAVATVHDVDYLLTWNCRHIANPEIQRGIAAYLEQIGLSLPFICTPEELVGEENAE